MQTQEEELKHLLLGAELDLLDRIEERCADLEARVGDDTSLRGSLRGVIVDVLRDAGVQDYERLATVLAPIVLASIRNEIKNSRDLMVDALYPITGRLVAAAVRNAFRELMESLNEKLDQSFSADRWKSRLKAKVTGRSEAEILLQHNPPLNIDEILVIHRPTGLLIGRAGGNADADEDEGADREVVSGMLTAIMSFSRDAFGAEDESDLESLAFGDSQLFLRTSPAVILAVRANGLPPKKFETALDQLFRSLLDQWGATLANFDGSLDEQQNSALQSDLNTRFSDLLAAEKKNFKTKSRKDLAAAAAVAACLVLWVGYEVYEGRRIAQIEQTGLEVVNRQAGLAGYPVAVRYDDDEERLLIEGLIPHDFSIERLNADLKDALPAVASLVRLSAPSLGAVSRTRSLDARLSDLNDRIAALKSEEDDRDVTLRKDFAKFSERLAQMEDSARQISGSFATAITSFRTRLDVLAKSTRQVDERGLKSVDAARARIDELEGSVGGLEGSMRSMISSAREKLGSLSQKLERQSASTVAVRSDLRRSLSDLEKSIGSLDQRVRKLAVFYQETTPRQLGELDRRTKELTGITTTISASTDEMADRLRLRINKLSARLAQFDAQPSTIDRLRDWTARNAIFFTKDNDLRSPELAGRKLRDLVSLLAAAPRGVRLSAIGYSDPSGRIEVNRRISQRRAEFVVDELKKLGAPDGRLIAVGRASDKLLSLATGNDSANRRVEFGVIQIQTPATRNESQ